MIMAPRNLAAANAEDRALRLYLQEIGEARPLSGDQEKALARKIRKGDEEALNQLVFANLRFVVSVAKKFKYSGIPLLDLINEGNVGLIEAAKRFDADKGCKFITYAVWWIRQAILQAIAQQSRIVRLPVSKANMAYKVGKMAERLGHTHHREATIEEIAKELKVDPRQIEELKRVFNQHLSLNGPLSDDTEAELYQFVPNDSSPMPDEMLMDDSLAADVEELIASLPPRESKIMRLYFGLGRERPHTLQEIGDELGLTRERVRQIKEKVISKLRKNPRGRELESYLH
jgi:RNA polymerase primary sigma factor